MIFIDVMSDYVIHRHGTGSTAMLFDDVNILERPGLVEKDEQDWFCVPWDEIDATFSLAAKGN